MVHVDLRPEEPKPQPAPGSGQLVRLDRGGVIVLEGGPDAVVSTVLLNDGKTPAFAAEASLYLPGYRRPVRSGISDTAGRLAWHSPWATGHAAYARWDGLVERPTVLVWIPGRTGAAILAVEPGQSSRVTLPAPCAAEGRITLGGRPVGGRNARIRVVAAYTGRGVLDGALSVTTTAQADGRFALRGLTPGRYVVQASRDGIWLSRGLELIIEPDKDPAPLALDVPEPGAPMTLQVVDREGRPVADQPIGLIRPEGPLASLWPASLRTDPGGILTLRGLESGRHVLLIGVEKERHEIVVPAADGAEALPAAERIVVPRAAP